MSQCHKSTKLCHNKTCLNEHYFLYSYSKTKTLITCSVVTSWSGSYSLQDKTDNQLIFIAPAYSRVRYRSPNFRPSVLPFVRPSVRPSTFTSKFDIYVEVFVFSALVIAVTVKPCIVIVLDIPFKHAP